jgi:diguanylate cyclase (GGDEF)-like protein
MLVHLPGAFRAAQIFGAAYVTAPLGHQYAMELMAQAVERDVSCRSRPVEEIRSALEDSMAWALSAQSRYSLDKIRLLPPVVSNFLQNRKASEILIPPTRISDAPISLRSPVVPPPPSRLPLVMWKEAELKPLLAQWPGMVAGLQKLLDQEPPGEIRDPKLLSLIYFYQMADALMRPAFFDELTGLRNLRELDRLSDELNNNLLRKNKNSPGDFFLAVDIDHFKRINDNHGHAAGNIVLQKVAKRLFELTRKGDYAFRTGGEEFLVTLANAGDKGVPKVAQKIRREISVLDIPIPGLARPLRVTVSVGVARFRLLSEKDLSDPVLPKSPIPRSMEEADQALYEAKENGRNRVRYYWKK